MLRVRVAVVLVVGALLAFVSPAGAQDDSFSITLEGIITGQAEGDVVQLVDQPVPAGLVGATCTVSGATENNGSVHPGNNLIITSGDSTTTVPGVEEVPGQVVAGSGSAVLGTDVVISLEFGPGGNTSGGVTLTFDCAAVAPAPPLGGVGTGAGGTAGGAGQSSVALLAFGVVALVGSGALLGWKRFSTSTS